MGGFFAMAGTASITDVFFVHERGKRIGIWNFSVMLSNNLTPIVSGYVLSSLTWHWSFWLLAILWAIILAATLACFPETTFSRDIELNNAVELDAADSIKLKDLSGERPQLPTQNATISSSGDRKSNKKTSQFSIWEHSIRLCTIKPNNQTRVFRLCTHPVVLWGCFMWSVTFTWVILIGAVGSSSFRQTFPYAQVSKFFEDLLEIEVSRFQFPIYIRRTTS